MQNTVFVTGTDTDIGKTYVSCLILQTLNKLNLKTFAIKPIASGCHSDSDDTLKNQDALLLQQAASIKKPYTTVNLITFAEPIAPHIAAQKLKQPLNKDIICQAIVKSVQADADINLIEGVGGWLVPLNDKELLADVALNLSLPIILVVGIKLGCLNHALLTYQNILQAGGNLIGWVANCVEPETLYQQENIDTLKHWLEVPCLGIVPYADKYTNGIDNKMLAKCLLQQSCIT